VKDVVALISLADMQRRFIAVGTEEHYLFGLSKPYSADALLQVLQKILCAPNLLGVTSRII
jgi:hypothetical protein